MDLPEAVKVAKKFVSEAFRSEGASEVRFEEFEHDDKLKAWDITIGFIPLKLTDRNDAFAVVQNLGVLGGDDSYRIYKVVKVRETDGEVISAKIRDLRH